MRIEQYCIAVAATAALCGMGLGIFMAVSQDFTLMPAHAHLNLLGWVSMALYGLGKSYARLEAQGGDTTAGRKSLVMYRAAIGAHPQNFLAANELGVRLAQGGRYEQASEVLIAKLRALDIERPGRISIEPPERRIKPRASRSA